jgi:hypothetical protein
MTVLQELCTYYAKYAVYSNDYTSSELFYYSAMSGKLCTVLAAAVACATELVCY